MNCKICNKELKTLNGLGVHILKYHKISPEDYYKQYIGNASLCKLCGNPTKFIGLGKGYRVYCCKSCASADPEIVEKSKNTCLERYGIKQPMNSESSKQKRYNTNIKKYGTISPLGNEQIRKQIILNNQEKYGTDYPLENKEIMEKTKQSLIENYGVDNPRKSALLQKKRVSTLNKKRDKLEDEGYTRVGNLIDKYGQGWFHYRDRLGINILLANNLSYVKNEDISIIENYFNTHGGGYDSLIEKEIITYIESIYSGDTKKHTRKIIPPYELDLYLPELKLAVEINGTYYHSTLRGISKTYHYDKSKMCETLGIRLIHIYEWEWENYPDKIKSLLKIALGMSSKIYARNCIIKKISNKEAKAFNEKHHLQGHRNAQITYGLFYNNNLVQLMSFSKTKYNRNLKDDNSWEIIRGCPGSNNIVIGGVGKLFNHFLKKHNPNQIFSYCDFNKFDGKSYEAIGMKFMGFTLPNKWYIKNRTAINRNPAKYKQYKELPVVWGSGSKKYVWGQNERS